MPGRRARAVAVRDRACVPSGRPLPALPQPLHRPSPAGKYIENHGVVHNMFYNTTSKVKLPYHATLGIQRWWDNGSVPIWITAQRQVKLPPPPSDSSGDRGGGKAVTT